MYFQPSAEGLYRFDQNGLINNIVDTTKMLIVSPPSGEFTYTVVVKVAARNTFGVGPDATSRATINGSVYNVYVCHFIYLLHVHTYVHTYACIVLLLLI